MSLSFPSFILSYPHLQSTQSKEIVCNLVNELDKHDKCLYVFIIHQTNQLKFVCNYQGQCLVSS